MKTRICIAAALAVTVLFLAGCQSSAILGDTRGNTSPQPLLTEGEARDIALKDAGVTLDSVTKLHIQKDVDDGVIYYDVAFRQGDYEYDYEIDATTGKIVGFDKDLEAVATTPTEPKPTEPKSTEPKSTEPKTISADEAKKIALKHATLKESQVTALRVEKDKDDGVSYYDVEFRNGLYEYNYEIHAKTGKIIEWDKEIDD